MRSLLVIALLALTGCSSSPPPLPKQPDAPTKESVVTAVGKEWDKADQKVAAAVTIARENAERPEVVKAETAVALSFLPSPEAGELALARARAAKADQKDYAQAVDFGKNLLAKIDTDWAKVVADQKQALHVSQLKDRRIEELTAEVERVKKDMAASLWTMAAVATAVLGALAMAFAGPKIGISLLASSAAIGAFPFIVESEYFGIIVGTSLGLGACIALWVIWDKARDYINKSNEPPKE